MKNKTVEIFVSQNKEMVEIYFEVHPIPSKFIAVFQSTHKTEKGVLLQWRKVRNCETGIKVFVFYRGIHEKGSGDVCAQRIDR